jgi:hypothetical protein
MKASAQSYITCAGISVDHEAMVTLIGWLAQSNPCNIGNKSGSHSAKILPMSNFAFVYGIVLYAV